MADRVGAGGAVRAHGRLRRGARARAPGAHGRLRPRAHRPAPDGRHLSPGRREPLGAPAQAPGRAGGPPDADPGGGVGGGPADGTPVRRRRLRGALQRRRHGALRVGGAAARRAGPPGRALPRAPRGAQGPERPPRCVRHGGTAGRPLGGRRRAGERGATAPAPRVRPGALARHAERRRGGGAPGRGRCPVCSVAARRVLRDGAPRGHGGGLRGGRLGHRGLPVGGGRARRAGAARDAPALARRSASPWPTPSRGAGARHPRRARRRPSTPGPGPWTPWPSATSTCTPGPLPSVRRGAGADTPHSRPQPTPRPTGGGAG